MVNCDSCLNKSQCIVCKEGFELAYEGQACSVAGTITNNSENNNSNTESGGLNSITKDTIQTATE